MSFAWLILQEELKQGHIEINLVDNDKDALDFQCYFPKKTVSHSDLIKSSELRQENLSGSSSPTATFQREIRDFEPFEAVDETSQDSSDSERIIDKNSLRKYRKRLIYGNGYTSVSSRIKQKRRRQRRIHREIVMQKMSRVFAIPKEDFRNVVYEIMEEEHPNFEIEKTALVALQREAEMMITKMMCLANHLTNHASRETLLVKDFNLLKLIFKKNKDGCAFEL